MRKRQKKRSLSINDLRNVLAHETLAHLTNGDITQIVSLAERFLWTRNAERADGGAQ